MEFFFELYVDQRQLKRLKDKVIPKEVSRFKDVWQVSQEDYNKTKDYGYEKARFGIIHNIVFKF